MNRRSNHLRALAIVVTIILLAAAIAAAVPTKASEPKAITITPAATTLVQKSDKQYLGKFRVTAYCPCEICCGEWAKNRPDGIVVGAAGVELTPNHSVASTLPFGAVVEMDGQQFVVEDRMANWVVRKHGESVMDIYFTDHEEAKRFGVQYIDVWGVS